MNISKPDKNSEVYKQYIKAVNDKVNTAISWLLARGVEYIWNNWISGHLYRLYIPAKDLLLDFELYPQNNINYNYIRINFDTDIITILERLFPETTLDTQELTVWKLNQKSTNKFLRENNASPIYDKSVLRVALVKDTTIYQCVIVKEDKIISNVIRKNCSVPYGTYIILRYLNEMFGIPVITIKDNSDNSYNLMLYQLLNLPVTYKSPKIKIWWNGTETKWRIDKKDIDKYIPFYYSENITYQYPPKILKF